jgi:hypothetical protein
MWAENKKKLTDFLPFLQFLLQIIFYWCMIITIILLQRNIIDEEGICYLI